LHRSLDGGKFTDAGLKHLKVLHKLTYVNLTRNKVTAAGVKKLHAALPKCMIVSDWGTYAPAAKRK
jgi:hypothetical protein